MSSTYPHSAQTEPRLRQKFPPRRLLSGSAALAAALFSAGGALAVPSLSLVDTVTTGANGNANFVTMLDIHVVAADPAIAVTSYTVVNPAGGTLPGVTANSIAGCSIAIGGFASNPVVYPCTATINAPLTAITVTGFPATLPTGANGYVSVMVTYNMWTAAPGSNDTVEHNINYTLGGVPAVPLTLQFNNGGTFVGGPATFPEMSIIPGIAHETRPTDPGGVVRFITGFVNTGNSPFTMTANADWIAQPQLPPSAATAPTCTILDITGTTGGSLGTCNYNPATGVISSGAGVLPATINVNGRVRFELTYTVQPGTPGHTVWHLYDSDRTSGTSVSDDDDAPVVYALPGGGAGAGGVQSVPVLGPLALGGMAALLALVPPCLARRRGKAAGRQ